MTYIFRTFLGGWAESMWGKYRVELDSTWPGLGSAKPCEEYQLSRPQFCWFWLSYFPSSWSSTTTRRKTYPVPVSVTRSQRLSPYRDCWPFYLTALQYLQWVKLTRLVTTLHCQGEPGDLISLISGELIKISSVVNPSAPDSPGWRGRDWRDPGSWCWCSSSGLRWTLWR